jgi:hypothetical protein
MPERWTPKDSGWPLPTDQLSSQKRPNPQEAEEDSKQECKHPAVLNGLFELRIGSHHEGHDEEHEIGGKFPSQIMYVSLTFTFSCRELPTLIDTRTWPERPSPFRGTTEHKPKDIPATKVKLRLGIWLRWPMNVELNDED